jgi:hypothetical protein
MMMQMIGENQCVTVPCNSNTEYMGILLQDSVFIALPSYQRREVEVAGNRQSKRHILIDDTSWVSVASRTSIL